MSARILSLDETNPTPSKLTEKRFWEIMDEIGKMGKFIAAVTNSGASANLVGLFSVQFDGTENIFERKECSDHIHLSFSSLNRIVFTYTDAGYGPEPSIEFQDTTQTTFLRLYYIGTNAPQKQKQLMADNPDISFLVHGSW